MTRAAVALAALTPAACGGGLPVEDAGAATWADAEVSRDASVPDAAVDIADATFDAAPDAPDSGTTRGEDAAVEVDAGPIEPVLCDLADDLVIVPEEGRLQAAAAAATSSGFVVVYGIRDDDEDVLRASLLQSCGAVEAESLPVDDTGSFIAAGASVAALPGGGFAVGWSRVDGDPTDDGAVLQTFDGEGRARSAVTTMNETEPDSQFVTSAASMPDGVAFSWVDYSPADFLERPDVRFRVFDADGVPLTDEALLTPTAAGRQDLPVLGAATDGAFLSVHHEDGLFPWARRRSAHGEWTDDELLPLSAERKQVTSIASNGEHYGIGMVSRAVEERGDVELALLDAASGEIEVVSVSATADVDEEDTRVAALPGGGWLVAWTDRSLVEDDGGRGVLARRLLASGAADGERFLVPTTTLGDQVLQAAVAGPGGVLIVWIDDSQADGRRGTALRARLLPHVVAEEAQ